MDAACPIGGGEERMRGYEFPGADLADSLVRRKTCVKNLSSACGPLMYTRVVVTNSFSKTSKLLRVGPSDSMALSTKTHVVCGATLVSNAMLCCSGSVKSLSHRAIGIKRAQ